MLSAIASGIEHMGFSDHFPFRFENGSQSAFRVPIEQAQDYCNTIHSLAEKYKAQIDLHLGFEMEYYPTLFAQMLQSAKDLGAQYLILGQHFLEPEYLNYCSVSQPCDDAQSLKTYANLLIEAMQTGAFTYVAHPDIFFFTGERTLYEQQVRRICQASLAYNIPLEINFLGIRDQRHYPNDAFWEIAGQVGCPVTFGFDAHKKENAADLDSARIAYQMVQDHHLNYIGAPKLLPLK